MITISTELIMQGGSIELDENFNLVRHRVNLALNNKHVVEQGGSAVNVKGEDVKWIPAHEMSFKTVIRDTDEDSDDYGEVIGSGRVSVHIDKYIAVVSDEEKDNE